MGNLPTLPTSLLSLWKEDRSGEPTAIAAVIETVEVLHGNIGGVFRRWTEAFVDREVEHICEAKLVIGTGYGKFLEIT